MSHMSAYLRNTIPQCFLTKFIINNARRTLNSLQIKKLNELGRKQIEVKLLCHKI